MACFNCGGSGVRCCEFGANQNPKLTLAQSTHGQPLTSRGRPAPPDTDRAVSRGGRPVRLSDSAIQGRGAISSAGRDGAAPLPASRQDRLCERLARILAVVAVVLLVLAVRACVASAKPMPSLSGGAARRIALRLGHEDVRRGWADRYRVGACRRRSRRTIVCNLWESGHQVFGGAPILVRVTRLRDGMLLVVEPGMGETTWLR